MIPQNKPDQKFTYADYLKWPDEERWEIIEGKVWSMSPAPNTIHQEISMFLSSEIYNFLKGKSCRVFAAPFDVRFTEFAQEHDEDIKTVVQPDISVICDPNKIDKQGCLGAPDIVVEILSPSTAYKDESEKLTLYEKHGVREYWIINPKGEYIQIYRLDKNEYGKPDYLKGTDVIKSVV